MPQSALIRMFNSSIDLAPDEATAVRNLPMQVRSLRAKQDIVRQGDRPSRSCTLLEGYACTYQDLHDGRRQIMAFHVGGDIPDLQSSHLAYLDHSLGTIGPCTVGFIDHIDLRRICQDFPRIAGALWRLTLIDACIFRAWISNLGARNANRRAAHLICETAMRMNSIGQVRAGRLNWPFTQADLGDALGISIVHVNRTMQKLRADGLISLRDRILTIHDWPALKEFGGFDPDYLHLDLDRLHPDSELH